MEQTAIPEPAFLECIEPMTMPRRVVQSQYLHSNEPWLADQGARTQRQKPECFPHPRKALDNGRAKAQEASAHSEHCGRLSREYSDDSNST